MEMRENPDAKQRRSIQLKEFDYTSAGAYFVTICTRGREMFFGEVLEDVVRLSEWGEVVQSWWHNIPSYFNNVECDEFVIMPNHIHGIIHISDSIVGVGATPGGDLRPPLRRYGECRSTTANVRANRCLFQIPIHETYQPDPFQPWRENLAAELL
jgi:hypothetical protein